MVLDNGTMEHVQNVNIVMELSFNAASASTKYFPLY